jgi:hypothetical protein
MLKVEPSRLEFTSDVSRLVHEPQLSLNWDCPKSPGGWLSGLSLKSTYIKNRTFRSRDNIAAPSSELTGGSRIVPTRKDIPAEMDKGRRCIGKFSDGAMAV